MKYLKYTPVLMLAVLVLLISCGKELSYEIPTNGGNSNFDRYGWSLKNDTGALKGCVTHVEVGEMNGTKSIQIYGTDTSGNSFMIAWGCATSNFKPGTYNVANGAAIIFYGKNGGTYILSPPSSTSFTLEIITLNDTLIEAKFNGTLQSIDEKKMTIKDGVVKARIGSDTPCDIEDGGDIDPVGDPAIFSIDKTASNCSHVNGIYYKGITLTSGNTIDLAVHVATIGTWKIEFDEKNGIKVAGSGKFTEAGDQIITLKATGTPVNIGDINYTIKIDQDECPFKITVMDAPIVSCTPNNNNVIIGSTEFDCNIITSMTDIGDGGYIINGNKNVAMDKTIQVRFKNGKPKAGLYSIANKDVSITVATAFSANLNDSWISSSDLGGTIAVTITNNKISLIACSVSLINAGSLASTLNLTAKLTEK